ncbi:MAG: flavodoxin family protein [Bacillota bacterium]
MKILAIVGSFRKEGNTDLIIDRLLTGAAAGGAVTEKLFVDDLQVASCQGCLDCRKEGICKIEDDLMGIVRKLDEADGIIVGSPIYGNYMTGRLKILLDRLMGVIGRITYVPGGGIKTISRLAPKRRNIVTVLTAGAPTPECADDALKLLRRMLGSMANGGFMEEIVAVGVNAKGAVTMPVEELADIARNYGVPDPEEAGRRAKARNDGVLARAYDIGRRMTE